jgi:hypothetical protein
MEPWRAVGAHSGGVETQKGALEGVQTSVADSHETLARTWIQIRIQCVKLD